MTYSCKMYTPEKSWSRIRYLHHLLNVITFPLDWKGKRQGFPLPARHIRPFSLYHFPWVPPVSAALRTWRKVMMMHLMSIHILIKEKIHNIAIQVSNLHFFDTFLSEPKVDSFLLRFLLESNCPRLLSLILILKF